MKILITALLISFLVLPQTNNNQTKAVIKSDSISTQNQIQIQNHVITDKPNEVLPVTKSDPNNYEIYLTSILSFIAGILFVFLGWWLTKNSLNQTKFEENFFKLLDTQDAILNTIDYQNISGRSFFFTMMLELKHLYNYQITLVWPGMQTLANTLTVLEIKNRTGYFVRSSPILKMDKYNTKENKLILAQYCYSFFFDTFYNKVGHYFRHLYHILKYIESNEKKIEKFANDDSIHKRIINVFNVKYYFSKNKKLKKNSYAKHYADLIQARMSAGELCLLFYNSLIFPEMKKYVDRYELTENLAIEDLMNESHKEFVPFKMKSRKEHTKGLFEFENKD